MTQYTEFRNWLQRHFDINKRLKSICTLYIIFLMLSMRKHTLEEGARLFGISKSQFSRFLQRSSSIAVYNLKSLAKKQAKQFFKLSRQLANGSLPWKVAVVIDSTLQGRSSLHTENAKRFNHGKGFVIGHQWTNIVLIIFDVVIPLPPIPFYSKKYCKEHGLQYVTENTAVARYLKNLNLEEYIGPHSPHDVIVLADSGYDDKKIERTINRRNWSFIIALKKNRSVKSVRDNQGADKAKSWFQVSDFFTRNRWAKWQTIRVPVDSQKKKRMEFRIRQINGLLRHVGNVQLICSEFRKRPDGRRKYLACNDLKVKARQIIIGYRLRWAIEIFHKQIKMFLGFEEVAAKYFESIKSHVHWVYCAYILLNLSPPGISSPTNSLKEKQLQVEKIIASKATARVIQLLTRFNGADCYKEELQRSLMAA